MTEEELQAALEKTTPERDRYELFVEDCQDQDVRVRFSPAKGEGWSTAALLAIAETSLRAAAGPQAVISFRLLTPLVYGNGYFGPNFQFTGDAVPEPSTWAAGLLAAGALLASIWRRRRGCR